MGIPENIFTRVVREDPVRQGLLYAGTETGVQVSFDEGEHWQSLRLNLPVVAIHELVIKDDDLVAATHGRSFWILDDVTPLRQMSEDMQNSEAYLFKPRPATRFMTTFSFSRPASYGKFYRLTGATMATIRRKKKPDGEMEDEYLDAGMNPPDGVIVTYYLKQKPEDEVKLTFLDAGGKEIRTFSSEKKGQPSSAQDETAGASDEIPSAAGGVKNEKKDDEKK